MNSMCSLSSATMLNSLSNQLVIRYTFDTSTFSGVNIKNVATGQNEATTVNSATYSTSSYRQGNASLYLVKTSSQYVNVNTSFTTGINGITFTCWFRNNNATTDYGRIFNFHASDKNNVLGMLVNYPSVNNLYVSVFSGTSTSEFNTGYATAVNDDTWRHMAWVCTPYSSNTNYLYINGSLVSTFLTWYPPSVARTGSFGNNDYGNSLYNGYIDDFRFYDKILNANQIQAIYNDTT